MKELRKGRRMDGWEKEGRKKGKEGRREGQKVGGEERAEERKKRRKKKGRKKQRLEGRKEERKYRRWKGKRESTSCFFFKFLLWVQHQPYNSTSITVYCTMTVCCSVHLHLHLPVRLHSPQPWTCSRGTFYEQYFSWCREKKINKKIKSSSDDFHNIVGGWEDQSITRPVFDSSIQYTFKHLKKKKKKKILKGEFADWLFIFHVCEAAFSRAMFVKNLVKVSYWTEKSFLTTVS